MTASSPNSRIAGSTDHKRCWWCTSHPELEKYHDTEWGRPVTDDRQLFERICLEGFQAGLSWLTVLRKRDRFREVFAAFDPERLVTFTPRDVQRLLRDPGIIRHRGKIESVLNNAARCLELIDERGSFAAFLWSYSPQNNERPQRVTRKTIPSETPSSRALSKALRARGWKFVGPTTLYAAMQAIGIVNDHVDGCPQRQDIERLRRDVISRSPAP